MKYRASLLASALLLVASSASAEFVDFRSNQFSGLNYRTTASFTTASGATATITPGPVGASFYWGSDDGLGVRFNGAGAYQYDEIEGPETLSLTFSQPVYIESILLTDLFRERTNLGQTYNETGSYTLGNGTVGNVVASGVNSGNQTVTVGAWTQSIVFRAIGEVGGFFGLNTRNNEYSLGGITFGGPTAVPEFDPSAAGAALILLLGGLAVLGGKRRNALV